MSKTLAKFVQATREGFNDAFELSRAEGFPEHGALRESTASRVLPILAAVEQAYGDLDLDSRHQAVTLAASQAVLALNDAIINMEVVYTSSDEVADAAMALVIERAGREAVGG